jgi:hypothetical protein
MGRGAVCINLLTPVSNPQAARVPLPARRTFVDELSAVCQKNFIHHIDQVTDNVLNSPDRTRTGHQVSSPYAFSAFIPPSLPSRPGPSILGDGRSEGWLTIYNNARRWSSKVIRNRSRRMSFGQYHATTAE